MAIFKAIVAERIGPGDLVFWWQSDGKLRPRAEEGPFNQPVGCARCELLPGQLIEITEGEAMNGASRMTVTPRGEARLRARDAPPPLAPINQHVLDILKRYR